jgi:hypothetical protein
VFAHRVRRSDIIRCLPRLLQKYYIIEQYQGQHRVASNSLFPLILRLLRYAVEKASFNKNLIENLDAGLHWAAHIWVQE